MSISKTNWSNSAVGNALIRELRTGVKLKEANEQYREIAAAREAEQYRGMRTLKGLGKHIGEIPQWEYHNLVNKYGYAEVHSREFWKYYQKKFPHLATSKV
jgi:hypothetical protein